jgi:hypothetical protein
MEQLVKTQQMKKMIANLSYGFETSKGIERLEGTWVDKSLTDIQKKDFNIMWHQYANTRLDFALMLISGKWI